MYALLRPLLFKLDPARAHALAMNALAPVEHIAFMRAALRAVLVTTDPRLEVRKMGLVFPNPIGVAAGLDKNGDRPLALASLGFGHVELGTVTAEAQGPNPPPNMFRLPADRAIVNRLGFPNEGASNVAKRLASKRAASLVPLGVSIGKSRSVPLEPRDKVLADYIDSFRAVRGVADFVVVNISSPNTKDLRAMQATDAARDLFVALMEANGTAEGAAAAAAAAAATDASRRLPILVKIAPDLPDEAVDAICEEVGRAGLAGVVATNTTISREGLATSPPEIERIGAGGLSGPPLFPRALSVVKRARACLGSSACVIGVGGVHGLELALAMLRAGADLVQIYTSFVYEGPFLPRALSRGLIEAMNREGASTLAELVSTTATSSASSTTTTKTNGVHVRATTT